MLVPTALTDLTQELVLGVADGITGLFTLPVKGAIQDGPVGFATGVGKGALGLPVKFLAAAGGVVGMPLKGIDVGITNALRGNGDMACVRSARLLQGEVEYASLSAEQREVMARRWRDLISGAHSRK
jgi:hypothetical protein